MFTLSVGGENNLCKEVMSWHGGIAWFEVTGHWTTKSWQAVGYDKTRYFLTGLESKWYIRTGKAQQFIRWHRKEGHKIILNYMPWHDMVTCETHDMAYDRTGHNMNMHCVRSGGMSWAPSWQSSCLLSSLAWPRSSSIMSTSSPPEFQSLGETIHRFLCAIGSQDTRKRN